MTTWQLEFYKTARGSSPVEEFFDSLSDTEMERIDRKLRLLEALGTRLDPPHVDHIRGKIWELRITGANQHRILYVAIEDRRMLLLHGFTKKRQKTPPREIRIAEARYADFLDRQRQQ